MRVPTGENIIGYGCWVVVAALLVYFLITKPRGTLIGILIFAGVTAVVGAGMFAWEGFGWLIHSEKQWAKNTIQFSVGLCVVVLMLGAAALCLDGMIRLYRREFVWFIILSSCLGYLMLYWIAKYGQK